MLERTALESIATALEAILGPGGTTIVTVDPSAAPRKAAAARALGPTARIALVRRLGWGAGFEVAPQLAHLTLDLGWDPEELVSAALVQLAPMIAVQTRRRGLAAAIGIAAPLGTDSFVDLRRLRIDQAVAAALLARLGSDGAVRRWLQGQLRSSPNRPGSRSVLRVVGIDLRPTCRLAPFVLVSDPSELADGPVWIDGRIRLTLREDATVVDAHDEVMRILGATPLRDRTVVSISPWPHPDVCSALARLNAARPTGPSLRLSAGTPAGRRGWSAAVEARPIRIVEAFC